MFSGAGGHAAPIFMLMELVGARGWAAQVLQDCDWRAGSREGSRGAGGGAAYDATGSIGAMIEVLLEVLVASVGLGRVNTVGINEISACPKTVSSRLREKLALFSRRAHAQNRCGTHSPGRGDLPRLAIPAGSSSHQTSLLRRRTLSTFI